MEKKRVAFVHDWLVSYRGGEKVLEALLDLYPDAPIFTLFYDPSAMPETINRRQIVCNPLLNKCSWARKMLLPWLPSAIEAHDMNAFDLLISTSSCVAKGAIPGVDARHLCYLHSPMRYAWDQRFEYGKKIQATPLLSNLYHHQLSRLREWDVASNDRVDRFVVNSTFVQQRVRRYYGRESQVVHPPVDVERFTVDPKAPRDYFLVAGAFVPYKRFDLAIEACEALGHKLVVAGAGPSGNSWRRHARNHTEFHEAPDDRHWQTLMQGAKALIFPGVEDFGIIAIEALASGTPVIALNRGGSQDFVVPGKTGCFFAEPTVDALTKCLKTFRPEDYDPASLRKFADKFRPEAFTAKIKTEIGKLLT